MFSRSQAMLRPLVRRPLPSCARPLPRILGRKYLATGIKGSDGSQDPPTEKQQPAPEPETSEAKSTPEPVEKGGDPRDEKIAMLQVLPHSVPLWFCQRC